MEPEKDAEAWEQLLEVRPRNVGQFEELHGLENPKLELGRLILLTPLAEMQSELPEAVSPPGAGINEPQNMDPDSSSTAQCTPNLPFKSWGPTREVLKPGCVYLQRDCRRVADAFSLLVPFQFFFSSARVFLVSSRNGVGLAQPWIKMQLFLPPPPPDLIVCP